MSFPTSEPGFLRLVTPEPDGCLSSDHIRGQHTPARRYAPAALVQGGGWTSARIVVLEVLNRELEARCQAAENKLVLVAERNDRLIARIERLNNQVLQAAQILVAK